MEGDYLLADRGYSTARGLLHVERAGGRATVRVNTSSLPLRAPENEPFDLFAKVKGRRCAGMIGSWPVQAVANTGGAVEGWDCDLRMTQEVIRTAHTALRRQASKRATQSQPQTLEFAKYVILFTTFPTQAFPGVSVRECARVVPYALASRTGIQTLLGPGATRAPAQAERPEARIWLYGKLLAALLVEKLIRHASAISP